VTTDRPPGYQTLLAELKRRHVFKVAAVYGAVAFVVMQAADFLVPALYLPDAVTTAIALLAILGFPIAMVLAWAFDLTPAGVQRTDPATSGELKAIVAQPRARRWPAAILALVSTALLVGGVWWTVGRGGGEETVGRADGPAAASIAVLPFLNLSADQDNEYFSDGVTEEIITALSQLKELSVVSRSAVFRYKGENVDPRAVGRELGVGAILEGSVRREGDDIRITAQLIDVEDGFHIWSENYDRRYADIFDVQDDVARRIAEALQLNLTESEVASLERRPTDNLEAYELYSRARSEFYEYTPEGNWAALALYQRALAIDEDYALALAGLSLCQSQYINSGWSDDEDWLIRAEESARRALEIDPQLAEAHFAIGFVYEQRRQYDMMAEEMRNVLALNPNHAHAHDSQGDVLLRHRGQLDEALAEYEVALRLDPFLLPSLLNKAAVHAIKGRLAEADRQFESIVRDNPGSALVRNYHGDFLLGQGRYQEALASYRAALASVPTHTDARVGLAAALIELGQIAAAEREAEHLASAEFQGPAARSGRAYILGLIDLERGNTRQAIQRLSEAAIPDLRSRGGPSYKAALAEAYLADGRPAEAARQLEATLRAEPYRKPLHYELGLALEAAGEPDRAAAEYRRFLDAWRDADPDAPFVTDARARLDQRSE
jgi:TolB-like protein/Tfp pilus assembly protein PilF